MLCWLIWAGMMLARYEWLKEGDIEPQQPSHVCVDHIFSTNRAASDCACCFM